MLVRSALACVSLLLWLPLHAAHAVQAGLVNDFEDGLQEWSAGRVTPADVADGGPAGPGDSYLPLSSTGEITGPGSRMTAFTRNPGLIGDYTDVVAISMDLNNLGATDLELRLQLGGGADVVVTEAFSLSAMSGWTTAVSRIGSTMSFR